VCVVVECPSIEYLDSLVTNSRLMKYMSARSSDDELEPCLVVHCSPAAVVTSAAYQSWMSQSVIPPRLSNCDYVLIIIA